MKGIELVIVVGVLWLFWSADYVMANTEDEAEPYTDTDAERNYMRRGGVAILD